MYKQTFILALGISLAVLLSNCTQIDDVDVPLQETEGVVPNQIVMAAFDGRYADAQIIDWYYTKDGYFVADFWLDGKRANAWYTNRGQWMLGKVSTSIPEVHISILDALKETDYSSWRIDETHILEREGLCKVYLLVVEKDNKRVKLYFTRLGHFIKAIDNAVEHVDKPIEVVDLLEEKILEMFNNPEIADITHNSDMMQDITVGVLDGTGYKEVSLDLNYNWLSTFWALDEATVPPTVWDGFCLSAYYGCDVKEIKAMQNEESTIYLFHVIKDNRAYILSFGTNGALHSVIY